MKRDVIQIGGFGTRYLAESARVREAFGLLEHTLEPGVMGMPRELGTILSEPGPPNWAALGELAARYGLEMDFAMEEALAAAHGVQLG